MAIGNGLFLDEGEIEEIFVSATAPGGQNVNKLSTAVQMRFDVRRSPSRYHPRCASAWSGSLAGD